MVHQNFHFFLFFLLSISILFSEGCSTSSQRTPKLSQPPVGFYHEVQKGETLWSIARSYQIGIKVLAEANKLPEPSDLSVGQLLYIRAEKRK